jgi:hypothetical protein
MYYKLMVATKSQPSRAVKSQNSSKCDLSKRGRPLKIKNNGDSDSEDDDFE